MSGLQQLTHQDFVETLEEAFHIEVSTDQKLAARLVEAKLLGTQGGDRQAFSLLFHVPDGTLVPQGVYSVVHDRLGSHDIFLVPIERTAEGTFYEAVFT